MPTFKQKKSGGYFIHAPGDENPVNTFQIVPQAERLISEANIGVDDYLPWDLLFLLDDLSYLTTKGEGTDDEKFYELFQVKDGSVDEFTTKQRVSVLNELANDKGVATLCDGLAADWLAALFEQYEGITSPLTETIASAAGFSLETTKDWGRPPLIIAFTMYVHYRWLRDEATFENIDDSPKQREQRQIIETTDHVAYLDVPYNDVSTINDETEPIDLPDGLHGYVSSVWVDQAAALFLAFHSKEIQQHAEDVEDGLVLPRERLDDYPISPPPRTELSDLYEALRQLFETVNRIMEAEGTDVSVGDGSACDRWRSELEERLYGTDSKGAQGEIQPLGEQQRERTDISINTYRDWYGNGEDVTDFEKVDVQRLDDGSVILLYGLGVFSPGERVQSPISPDSGEPLPLYPRTEAKLETGRTLLNEFPNYPDA